MTAYEECLRATSTDDASWYVFPADHKDNARVLRPADLVLRLGDVGHAERRAVRLEAVLLRRAEMGAHEDQARPRRLRARLDERGIDRRQVVAVVDVITGQNPASSGPDAQAMLDLLVPAATDR